MLPNNHLRATAILSAVCILVSCSKMDTKTMPSPAAVSTEQMTSENGSNPDELVLKSAVASTTESHLYTESNKRSGNTIIEFTQKADGTLADRNEYASGGYGYGEALGSQGALAVSREMRLLFAVNVGSNSISSFKIRTNGSLQLLYTVSSYGNVANSLTIHGNTMYVLNTGSSTICGFKIDPNGFFRKMEGSIHNLSGLNVDAPQISFQPDGKALYVTEKMTNIIDKFKVDADGNITSSMQETSNGITPFGFDFSRNPQYLIVSNAANGFSGAGSCTSYKSDGSGLTAINGAVSDYQSAPCWVATTQYGSFAFVSNTGSDRISSYYIDKTGVLSLLKSVAAEDGAHPIDIVVSADNRYVYNINSVSHTISEYARKPAGVIELIGKVTTLPPYAVGLVSF